MVGINHCSQPGRTSWWVLTTVGNPGGYPGGY